MGSALEALRAKNRKPQPIALPLDVPQASPQEVTALAAVLAEEDRRMGGPPLLAIDAPAPLADDPFAPEVLPAPIADDADDADDSPINLRDFAPEPQVHGLRASATMVDLTIHFWAAQKQDDEVTQDVADRAGATGDAGRYIKHLLDRKSLAEPKLRASRIRQYVDSVTIPWKRGGRKLLPAAKVGEFKSKMRSLIADFDHSVVLLLSQLASLIDDRKAQLGSLFDPLDYPDVEEVRRRYYVEVEYGPVPAGSHFMLDLQDEEIDRLRTEVEEAANAALVTVRKELAARMHKRVAYMAEKLAGYSVKPDGTRSGVFRDSTVTNIQELVSDVPLYNFGNDPVIAEAVRSIETQLAPYSPEVLRSDDRKRAEVQKSAEAIAKQMAALF